MNKEILQYGIRALKSRHADIRRLKREHAPHLFGFRVWTSSWLLMDYFQQLGLRRGIRVMDIGCGWGLAGIYCAKEHAAVVTGVDEDSEVFPYLQVHARLNKVTITTMIKEFTGLTGCDMERTDMIIGADICFWDTMVATLTRLILTALGSGVQAVIIADPGRAPFEELGEYFVERGMGCVYRRDIEFPYPIRGKILHIRAPLLVNQ